MHTTNPFTDLGQSVLHTSPNGLSVATVSLFEFFLCNLLFDDLFDT
jgi:hypothetical protein